MLVQRRLSSKSSSWVSRQRSSHGATQMASAGCSRHPIPAPSAARRHSTRVSALPTFETDTRRHKKRGRPRKDSSLSKDVQRDSSKVGSPYAAPTVPTTISSPDNNPRSTSKLSSTKQVPNEQGSKAILTESSRHHSSAGTAVVITDADSAAEVSESSGSGDDIASSAAHGQQPPERIWRQELRHFSGIMSDPNKPWIQPFVLKHCYVVNTIDTRDKFIALTPPEMHKLISRRQRVEQRLSKSAHALSAAWKRLQLLSEAVGDKGQVLTVEQLNKERELVVQMRDNLQDGQKWLAQTVTTATELGDLRYLNRADTYRNLLTIMSALAESFLREYLRRIASASRLNQKYQEMWQNTPEPLREPLYVVEGRRQQQLLQLQSLAPDHPTQLLADYREAALKFETYQDKQLLQRKPKTGQPTSTGGIFWQTTSVTGTLPMSTPAAAAAAYDSLGPVAVPKLQQQSIAKVAWQQNPQQLMARPLQQLPLLPHLGRHHAWLPQLQQQQQRKRQQEVALHLQLEQQQQQQEDGSATGVSGQEQQQQRVEQMRASRSGDLQDLQRPAFRPSAAEGDADHAFALPPTFSYSGKVVPPMPVLLHRALALEARLIQEAEEKRAKFAVNNAEVQAQRRGPW